MYTTYDDKNKIFALNTVIHCSRSSGGGRDDDDDRSGVQPIEAS